MKEHRRIDDSKGMKSARGAQENEGEHRRIEGRGMGSARGNKERYRVKGSRGKEKSRLTIMNVTSRNYAQKLLKFSVNVA